MILFRWSFPGWLPWRIESKPTLPPVTLRSGKHNEMFFPFQFVPTNGVLNRTLILIKPIVSKPNTMDYNIQLTNHILIRNNIKIKLKNFKN